MKYNPWSFDPSGEPRPLFTVPTPLRALTVSTGFLLATVPFMFFVNDPLWFGVICFSIAVAGPLIWHIHWKLVARRKEQEATDT